MQTHLLTVRATCLNEAPPVRSTSRDLSEKILDEQQAYCQLDYMNRSSIRE